MPVQCVRELIGLPAHWPLLSTTKSLTVDSSVTSPAGVSVLVVLLILVTGRIAYRPIVCIGFYWRSVFGILPT